MVLYIRIVTYTDNDVGDNLSQDNLNRLVGLHLTDSLLSIQCHVNVIISSGAWDVYGNINPQIISIPV